MPEESSATNVEHPVPLVLVSAVMVMTGEVVVITEEVVVEDTVEIEAAEVEITRVVEVVAMMEEVLVVIEVVLMEVIKGETMAVMARFLHLHPHLMVGLVQIFCLLQMLMGEMLIMVLRLFLLHQAMVGAQHHTLRCIVAHPVVMVVVVVVMLEMQGLEVGGVHPLGMMEAMAVALHGTMGVVMEVVELLPLMSLLLR